MPCGGAVADHAEVECAVVVDGDIFDRAIERRHAAGDRAAFERRPGGATAARMRCSVAEDQFGIGADIHDGDEPVLVRDIDRQHAGRRIGADVAADDRRP